MNEYIIEEMNKLKADGVDFVELGSMISGFPKVIASYTREEIPLVEGLPRSGKLYWKVVKGNHKYISKFPNPSRSNIKEQ